MKHYLRTVFLFVFLVIAADCLKAVVPSNDSVCHAIDRACPANGDDDFIRFFSPTNNASFSPVKIPAALYFSEIQDENNYDNVKVELSH